MQANLLVMAGGALGALGRYQLGRLAVHAGHVGWPAATLAANIAGGFAMGLLVGVLARTGGGGEGWRLFLGIGLLGGFTTFSSFSMEVVLLAERGAIGAAAGYAFASVAGAVLATLAGLWLARIVAA